MVTRVWGRADSFELVFSPSDHEHWYAPVPADLKDGQYIVELYCEDDCGNLAYWTGILYLCNADEVKLRIVADKFKVWLKSDDKIDVKDEEYRIWIKDDGVKLKMICIDYVGRG